MSAALGAGAALCIGMIRFVWVDDAALDDVMGCGGIFPLHFGSLLR